MKLCRDCTHCNQANPFLWMCDHPDNPGAVDVVTGHRVGGTASCATVRHDTRRCGVLAAWFEPATLDARLEMLEENTTTIYIVTFDGEKPPKAFRYRSAAEKQEGGEVNPIEYWDKQ